MNEQPVPLHRGATRLASTAATTTAIGAIACGVCCVLPFALPAVALAGTGGVIAWFGQAFWGGPVHGGRARHPRVDLGGHHHLPHQASARTIHPSGDAHGDGGARRRAHLADTGATHSQSAQRLNMVIRRRAFLTIPAVLLAVKTGVAQNHPTEQYTPSDPALVGRTGRPQLVEFFHHL